MRAPAIRYPAFWLVGIMLLAGMARLVWPWTLPVRSAVADGWRRVIEGPPVPASAEPMTLVGPIARRGLLLRERTPVTDVPGGRTVETIGRRVFVDLYDVWPLEPDAPPTHYRIGNERPFGWVRAGALLPWSTRLAVRVPDSGWTFSAKGPEEPPPPPLPGGAILPVLDWDSEAVHVALWREGEPWRSAERVASIPSRALADLMPGVLLSRTEVVHLLRESIDAATPLSREELRLRASFGLLVDPRALPPDALPELRAFLPSWAVAGAASPAATSSLADLNADWRGDVTLSGGSYRLIPLDVLP